MFNKLRPAQKLAIDKTYNFWRHEQEPSKRKFLWNAKPRFGKTFASYAFAQKIHAKRILIITNRPAISDSWQSDFLKFLATSTDYIFVTQKAGPGTFSRADLLGNPELLQKPLLYFISLQDLKGKDHLSGQLKAKNRWIFDVSKPWDLLIIDEGHDGIKTDLTTEVVREIKTDFTLYLSGTPFRAVTDQDFAEDQIFNWTYLDECRSGIDSPMLSFQLFDDEMLDDDAKLDVLAQHFQEKNLSHTFWFLRDVASCKSLAKKLAAHPFFSKHRVVLAVGKNNKGILTQVHTAVQDCPFTITLSCNQLTTGITIPEWSGVVIYHEVNDLASISAANYIQTIFRATTLYHHKDFIKHSAEIFDFQPARALQVLQEYADKLCAGDDDLISLAEYLNLTLWQNHRARILSARDLHEMPQRLLAQNIVNRKFSSLSLIRPENIPKASYQVISKIGTVNRNHISKSPSELAPRVSKDALSPIKQLETPSTYRDHHPAPSFYIQKLQQLMRAIPFLLFLHGSEYQKTSDFEFLTGITNKDFQDLIKANCINVETLKFAEREFMTLMEQLSDYYKNSTPHYIFDYIAEQNSSNSFATKILAVRMADMLEAENSQIFQSKSTTFYDPAAKSGMLLAEIIRRLYHNLRPQFSSDARCLSHILKHQIYATCHDDISHRAVSKLLMNCDNIKLHGEPMPKNRFNVIISNPPYQQGRRQVYADFYKLAVDLDPDILCMVFPSGWQSPNNRNGLAVINNKTYKRDPHIVSIDNYSAASAEKIFPELRTGSINIVLRDRKHHNRGYIQRLEHGVPAGTMILPLEASEVPKPELLTPCIKLLAHYPKMSALGSARKPYGFYADPLRRPEKYHLNLQDQREHPADVRLFGLLDDVSRGYKYIPRRDLPKVSLCIDSWKIFVPKAWGNMSEKIGLGGSFANICVARPGDVCSETFIEFGPFKDQDETIKMAKYFMTKFFRALLFLAKTSQNTAKDKYKYIPVPDLNNDIFDLKVSELDEKLFEQYAIPDQTREFIVAHVQPRDETNIELL